MGSTLAWFNIPLAVLVVLAVVGIPLWMTFKRPQKAPDHSEAHAYLRAKKAARQPVWAGGAPGHQAATHPAAAHPAGAMSQARRHASAGAAARERDHAAGARAERNAKRPQETWSGSPQA